MYVITNIIQWITSSCLKSKIERVSCLIFLCSFGSSGVLYSGSVAVSWDANPESDLSGYKIYYGKQSNDYSHEIVVGNVTSYRVAGLESAQRYYFAVTAFDFSGNESGFSEEVSIEIPEGAGEGSQEGETGAPVALGTLVYNFPNPFKVNRESTTIRYEVLNAVEVTIEIMDPNNNLVKTVVDKEFKAAGEHTEDSWNGTNANAELVANGIYLCRIRANNEQRFVKIAVLR